MSRRSWFAVPPLVLAACGGPDPVDTPLLGTWQVTTHAETPGCTGAANDLTDPPFVRFIAVEVRGVGVAELVECTSATMCEESDGALGKVYAEEIAGGRRRVP